MNFSPLLTFQHFFKKISIIVNYGDVERSVKADVRVIQ